MDANAEAKLFGILDVLSIEVSKLGTATTGLHDEFVGLRAEMHVGFERLERRFGNLETRVEGFEDYLRSNDGYVRARLEDHERRITALE